ncbi:hypothetical protein B1K54_35270 [Streptomyces sp. fd1-xmd]|uniref:Secreted protein n=1 Tax=Streptomyces amritsarensis TaxID=681158 RepID=A0ABX3FVZ9_9ACTN|nr:hypothetical protein B1K54_35270 [Streptomyces sp. fd1-xmd]OLZ59359.1 hypothetical protein AVW11_26530 [Streptomyces amritsarensis]
MAALRSLLVPLIALVEAVESEAISATATSHRSQSSPARSSSKSPAPMEESIVSKAFRAGAACHQRSSPVGDMEIRESAWF